MVKRNLSELIKEKKRGGGEAYFLWSQNLTQVGLIYILHNQNTNGNEIVFVFIFLFFVIKTIFSVTSLIFTAGCFASVENKPFTPMHCSTLVCHPCLSVALILCRLCLVWSSSSILLDVSLHCN